MGGRTKKQRVETVILSRDLPRGLILQFDGAHYRLSRLGHPGVVAVRSLQEVLMWDDPVAVWASIGRRCNRPGYDDAKMRRS